LERSAVIHFAARHITDFDFALIKTTPIGHRESGLERADLQFRGELFNLFNIVNMGLPANIIAGTGFGISARPLELRGKFSFR
jgi:hypothetical protein